MTKTDEATVEIPTSKTTTDEGDGATVESRRSSFWPWQRHTSARMRILGWYVVLLAISLSVALFIQRSFLLDQVITNADQALDQEVAEFRQMASGLNPRTGEPFGSASTQIFDTYLGQNVAGPGEAVITIVGDRPYRTDSAGGQFASTEIMERWVETHSTDRDQVDTDAGPVRYLAVPIFDSETQRGVFVVASFLQDPLDQVNQVIRIGALVYGSIFVIASAVAWVAAGDVLRPLRGLSRTTRSISESDLDERIPVHGDDEIAELSRTFNDMLDRLQGAFVGQRRFIDDASHELRTPITIIRGQLEFLDDDPEERTKTVELVTGELDRMTRIVDDMLTLAKVEQPEFIQRRPTDLAEFMDQIASRARSLGAHNVTIGTIEPVVIEVDEQRMTQAMVNLVKNAIVHNPADTTVRLDAMIVGDQIRLSVSDDGDGISPEDRETIFQRFNRGSSTRQSSDGAGLGLPIVMAVTERHGGEVEVISRRTDGTTFTMVIPTTADTDVLT